MEAVPPVTITPDNWHHRDVLLKEDSLGPTMLAPKPATDQSRYPEEDADGPTLVEYPQRITTNVKGLEDWQVVYKEFMKQIPDADSTILIRLTNAEQNLRSVLKLKERKLQYVGHGAKRVAFALGPDRKKVVKIEDAPETEPEAQRKNDYQKLCSSYFLPGTVLPEVHRPHHTGVPDVSFQDNTRRFNDKSSVVFSGGYAERKPDLDPGLYAKVSRSAILRKEPYDRRDFLSVQGNANLEKMFVNMDQDPEFRRNLEQLVSGLIFFSQDTGEILDCLGRENVHLYQDQNDDHHYRIIDPIPTGMRPLIPEANDIFEIFNQNKNLGHNEYVDAMNVVDFIRLVNSLADDMNMDPEERIPLLHEEIDFERFLKESQPIAMGKRKT